MPNLQLIPGTLANPLCYPASPQEFLNEIMEISVAVAPSTAGVVGPQDAFPDIEDRDKAWLRTVAGAPATPYLWQWFNAQWVAKHPMAANSGLIHIYDGTAASVDTLDGGTAGVATTDSGPFWAIVATMAGRVPIGVGTLLPSNTPLLVGNTGGVDEYLPTVAQMPAHVHRITAHGSNDPSNGNGVIAGGNGTTGPFTYDDTAISTSNHLSIESQGGSDLVNIMPPYIAVYFLRRTARIYLTSPIA